MAAITFIVSGQFQTVREGTERDGGAALPAGLTRGRVKSAVRVGMQRGSGGEVSLIAVPGEDVVVLQIADGPDLVLHPERARDLMLAQQTPLSRGASAVDGPGVRVPERLQWRGLEEGIPSRGAVGALLGGVALSAVYVVTGLLKDLAVNLLESAVVQGFDGQVEAGVYALNAEELPALKGSPRLCHEVPGAPGGAPLLVFLHGTFSDTPGTFGKLWAQHSKGVRSLFDRYGNRVYALDHPTLSVSPIANALTLARALPADARLHLVTHSRGGLVAEVLARLCADPDLAAAKPLFTGNAHAQQLKELRQLAGIVRERSLHVDRIVRVACPVRGTLLASGRLDAFLSVLKWTLALAKIPVAPELADLLAELARRRARPEELPGLAAQIPNSPLVRWLHAAKQPLPGDLRVVAGAMKGDSLTSWVKTLLADSFYWTDNDLVVQTRSMYAGAPRSAGAAFFLDRSGEVAHFSYFGNELTARPIVDAILEETPAGFRPVGPLSWAGKSPTGVRGPLRASGEARPAPEKPAVIVVPGLLGSNLKAGDQRIWPDWGVVDGLQRLSYDAGKPDGVEPDGLIDGVYDELIEFLSTTHQVIVFAYDWRRPIEEAAQHLATMVATALDTRGMSHQAVRLLAHSTGGLVARTMQLERPQVWDRMMGHPDARLLLLGTPNDGLWTPMQVLSGDDTLGGALAAFGAPLEELSARDRMAAFPGFLQLQAGLHGLARSETWKGLADRDLEIARQRSPWHSDTLCRWGLPAQSVLDQALELRQRLDAQLTQGFERFQSKLAVVVGQAPATPDGYEVDREGLVYLDVAGDGDGRVTWRSAQLSGVRTWQVPDCEHGALPRRREAFAAYRELLETGGTDRLKAPAEPAAQERSRSRPARTCGGAPPPPESPRDLMALDGRELPSAEKPPLCISVINGDLSFIRQPLLLGHYRSLRLTGSESVINRLIGGTMTASLAVDLYPDAPGTHQVFVNTSTNSANPLSPPRPEAVIVVGLGQEGELKAAHLAATVRQAVIAWSQRAAEALKGAHFDLAATLIGSGGTGIGPGQSALLIAQGVRDANRRLADNGWPQVRHLTLVELYHDRACDAWRTLRELTAAAPRDYLLAGTVTEGNGALPRPLTSGYRGADYDFISAETDATPDGESEIVYTLDTRRARSEVRAQALQGQLLRELVTRAANDANGDPQIGRTLFRLLVPQEMEAFFGGTTDLVIELDQGTAGIPWELLDSETGGADEYPWAIRTKLLRKLRTADFRDRAISAGAEAWALVIGEPQCEAPYPRLPGARAEADAVARSLGALNPLTDDRVRVLVGSDTLPGADARTIINALLERPWRIVHIAGHGAAIPAVKQPGKPGAASPGVVLSQGTFLSPRELHNMRVVPELVFVNCCYLAALSPEQLLKTPEVAFYDRASFASSVAGELINMGVRCVIAAGWAVGDEQGKRFATAFYAALLRGARFIDAVTAARKAAFDRGNNTWAAYQCYGDPDWSFAREAPDPQQPAKPPADDLAGIASPHALVLALKTLAVESESQKAEPAVQRARIQRLEELALAESDRGFVAEGFAVAFKALNDKPNAIRWYRRALAANDGTASFKAVEQLGNLQVKLAWDRVIQARKGDPGALPGVWSKARAEIGEALAGLTRLVDMEPTAERQSLCGSAYKRLAMIETEAKDPEAAATAFERMREHYRKAEKLARASGSADLFYPALNLMAAQLIVEGDQPGGTRFDTTVVNAVCESLEAKGLDDPDFWSAASSIELKIYLALAKSDLAEQRTLIEHEFETLHLRVSASWMWASVYEQAYLVLSWYAGRAGITEQEKDAAHALREWLRVRAKAP